MGLFKKKNTDYDELFTKLAAGNLSARELKNAEKALEELAESGDARGIIWRPLINIYKHKIPAAISNFSFAERQYGICEEYVRVRSLPVVFGLFSFRYDKYHEPASAVFTARSYEYGWGTEADHARALEIIRDAAERIHEGAFVSYAPTIKKVYLEITGEEIPEQNNPSAESGEPAEKDGEKQSGCDVAHDEGVKTAGDVRRAEDNASPAAASPAAPSPTSDRTEAAAAPHVESAAQGSGISAGSQDSADSADAADDFEWEEFSSIGELHEKLLHPELFRDPEDRYIINSCMYLDTFVDEFREEFAGDDYAETKEIIAEILGVESGELTECIERRLDFIHGFTEKEYLLAAMYSLAYDERTDLAPYLANLACYLWTDTGDGDYFDPLLDLFKMSGEYDDDDSTWLCAILRLRENGNIDEPLNPNGDVGFDYQFADFDYVFGDLLDKGYLPGSDGKMYLSDIGDDSGEKNRILADMYSDLRQKITGEPYRDKNDGKKTYPDGYNLITFDNGDVYEGNISEGMFHGQGKYTSHNGLVYEGYFVSNVPKGDGKLYYPNLYTYVGDVDDYKPDGYGTRRDVDGTTVRGMWKNGLPNGLICHYFPNKDIYIGEANNGDFIGIGVYLSPNGDILVGEFNNECLTRGEVMKYKSSFKKITSGQTEYYGQIAPGYINGQTVDCPNGHGERRYRNGGYELGIFKNSHLIHGASYFNNILKYGDFDENGNLNGDGAVLFISKEGLVSYKGTFRENRYHGKGIYTRPDGQSFLALWDNDKPVSIEQTWAANGSETKDLAYTGCKEDEGYILSLSRD